MVEMLLLCSVAFGGDKPALCELAKASILSMSSTGIAQVSNLGNTQITCSVGARPFPSKPGESLNGLTVATDVYEISGDGGNKLVPSVVHLTGGGGNVLGPEPRSESVYFYVQIPLDPPELDAEASRYLVNMFPEIARKERQRALEWLRPLVYQDRVGHFQVHCRMMDGERVLGVGVVEFEVLFKGRFSDLGLPAAPPV